MDKNPHNMSQSEPKRRRAKYIHKIDRLPHISDAEKAKLKEVAERYAFRVNDYYINLIDWSNPNDPIRNLVIPKVEELEEWGVLDASAEEKITVLKGVQHKYSSTVLDRKSVV